MTAFVLDAGALIALDRDERDVWALLRRAVAAETFYRSPQVSSGRRGATADAKCRSPEHSPTARRCRSTDRSPALRGHCADVQDNPMSSMRLSR